MKSYKDLYHGETKDLQFFCESITDCHHSTPVYRPKGKLVVRNFNIKDGRFLLSNLSYTDDVHFEQRISRAKPEPNDLIITREAPMGEVCIIPEGVECCLGQRMVLIKPDKTKADKNFLLYALMSEFTQAQIQQSNGTGSIVSNLRIPILKELKVPNLPITKQKQIGKVLSDIDKKIELNNKINTELEAMAKLIYDYWFVQFDFPDANGKPYKSSGGKMIYNEELKREIPESWEVDILDSYIELILDHRGKTPKKLGGDWTNNINGIIALSAKIVKNGKLINLEKANKVDQEMYDKWMPEKLQNGDFLMTSEAPTGEFYFIHGKKDYCMSQRLFAIRANKNHVYPSYLYYEMSKGHGYSQIMGSRSGSTVSGIRQDELRKILIVKPNIEIQKEFDQLALPILKHIKNLDYQNQKLVGLRDWLLPMLMNGQVMVT